MNDMKCPFCQQELDTSKYYIRCHNPHCDITEEMEGTEEMWDALIRTRKALDVAINVLNRVEDVKYEEYIDEKLEQINEIIALEQKDVK